MRICPEALPDAVLSRARELRRNQTSAEEFLWLLLRDRRLNGIKFRRQHPCPPYTIDFYARSLRLAVELDGAQHLEPGRRTYDEQRERDLNAAGIHVLRFTNDEVFQNLEGVLTSIWRFAQKG
jgi:adenine-specific DNA-methyltransferase